MKKIDKIKRDISNWEARNEQLQKEQPDVHYSCRDMNHNNICRLSVDRHAKGGLLLTLKSDLISGENIEKLYHFLREFFEDDNCYEITTNSIDVSEYFENEKAGE